MTLLDLHVEIGGEHGGYRVVVRGADGGEASAPLRLPPQAELEQLLARIPDALIASSARVRRSAVGEEIPVQRLGRLLFEALLSREGDGRTLLLAGRQRAAREDRRLRVILHVNTPALARLPWEFLYDAGAESYLCLASPVVRHTQVLAPRRPLQVSGPLRILCMIARPGDQQPVAVEDERRRMSQAMADLRARGLIEVHWVAGQTWRDLRRVLRPAFGGPWHVFHFIGHGGFDGTAQQGTLALADEYGGTRHLGAEDLAMVLSGHPSLRLVVLNACETARAAQDNAFSSVAGSLMRSGMPAVLAMQYPISDPAAVEFGHAFYESLAEHAPVDVAVMEARQALRLALTGTLEWGTPVLYLRSLDSTTAHLFDRTIPLRRPAPPPMRQKPPAVALPGDGRVSAKPGTGPFKPRLSRLLQAVIALAAIALAGVGFFAYNWTTDQYFVGASGDEIVVYRGVDATIGPLELKSVDKRTGRSLSELSPADQELIRSGIPVPNRQDGITRIEQLFPSKEN